MGYVYRLLFSKNIVSFLTSDLFSTRSQKVPFQYSAAPTAPLHSRDFKRSVFPEGNSRVLLIIRHNPTNEVEKDI